MSGPLDGVRIIEIAGLGAAPYGCMMLADMGADVVRVERSVAARIRLRARRCCETAAPWCWISNGPREWPQ